MELFLDAVIVVVSVCLVLLLIGMTIIVWDDLADRWRNRHRGR